MFGWPAGCLVRQEAARNAHSARNARECFAQNVRRGVLACGYFHAFAFHMFRDGSSREERGARKPSLLVQSPRKVPGTPSHPASTRICAGQRGVTVPFLQAFRCPGRDQPAVTCHDEKSSIADLRK